MILIVSPGLSVQYHVLNTSLVIHVYVELFPEVQDRNHFFLYLFPYLFDFLSYPDPDSIATHETRTGPRQTSTTVDPSGGDDTGTK